MHPTHRHKANDIQRDLRPLLNAAGRAHDAAAAFGDIPAHAAPGEVTRAYERLANDLMSLTDLLHDPRLRQMVNDYQRTACMTVAAYRNPS